MSSRPQQPPTLVLAWLRRTFRVHDNPIIVQAAEYVAQQQRHAVAAGVPPPGAAFGGFHHVDCCCIDDALFGHNVRFNQFIAAVQRFGTPAAPIRPAEQPPFSAPSAAGQELVSHLQASRRAFTAATLEEFGRAIHPVHFYRSRVIGGGGDGDRLVSLADGCCSLAEVRVLAARIRGRIAAGVVADSVLVHHARSALSQIRVFLDRCYDPEALAEEESFRAALSRTLSPAAVTVEFTAVSAHNLTADLSSLVIPAAATEANGAFPFERKPLAYNPFVACLEAAGVAAPLSLESAQGGLEVLSTSCAAAAAAAPLPEPDGRATQTVTAGAVSVRLKLTPHVTQHAAACSTRHSLPHHPSPSWVVPPGEQAALEALASLSDEFITRFSKPHTNPMATKASTTVLSPYLANGSLSARLCWQTFRDAEERIKAAAAASAAGKSVSSPTASVATDGRHRRQNGASNRRGGNSRASGRRRDKGGTKARVDAITQPPQSLVGQLYWREFAHFLHFLVGPSFVEMQANPVCLQRADWLPGGTDGTTKCGAGGSDQSDLHWLRQLFFSAVISMHAAAAPTSSSEQPHHVDRAHRQHLLAGVASPYPGLSAGIRYLQLYTGGWCHHIMRHFIACYLTRILDLSWEVGRDYFDAVLLDHDVSINASQWQWLSCSFLFYTFNRVYHCDGFAKKWDRGGQFVRAFGAGAEHGQFTRNRRSAQRTQAEANATSKQVMQALLQSFLATNGPESQQSATESATQHEHIFRVLYERRRDIVIAHLKQTFLQQRVGFLRNLQPNVVEEWRREDPVFAQQLEDKIRAARRQEMGQDCASFFDRNFPGFFERAGVRLCIETPTVTVAAAAVALTTMPSHTRLLHQRASSTQQIVAKPVIIRGTGHAGGTCDGASEQQAPRAPRKQTATRKKRSARRSRVSGGAFACRE